MKFLILSLIFCFTSCSTKPKVACSEENAEKLAYMMLNGLKPMVDSTSELLKLTSQLQEKKISDSEFDAQSGPIRRSVEEARNKIKSEATMFVLDYPERKTPAVEKFLKQ